MDGVSYRAISEVQRTQVRCGRLDDNHIQGQKDEIAKLCILAEKTENLGVWISTIEPSQRVPNLALARTTTS
jgi:hypothetical protein